MPSCVDFWRDFMKLFLLLCCVAFLLGVALFIVGLIFRKKSDFVYFYCIMIASIFLIVISIIFSLVGVFLLINRI